MPAREELSLTDTVYGLCLRNFSFFVLLSEGNKPDFVHSSEETREECNPSTLVFCPQGVQKKPQKAERGGGVVHL